MKPTAYLMTWPEERYRPSICLPEALQRQREDYPDVKFTPLYTPEQIGLALMSPAQGESNG